ncbi:cellulose synthase (UDP-forming) [Actinoplanes teichomyceticus]|uniref:Cellulose synthase (UDP-forming) n=2 Tax=Actinoplanes teichomyceticus TaxID=1867 RepID=A0A561WSL7_ACTTI|nr:cellulose synthase (UDP-forming) [Actinoplanes teichomyceticus]
MGVPDSFRIPRAPGSGDDKSRRPIYAPVPLPPTDREKYLYAKRRLAPLTLVSLVSFTGLLVSQVAFVRTAPWLLAILPLMAFTVLYYLISLAVNAFTRGFDLQDHLALIKRWQPERYPSVDVFLPVCGEAPYVLQNTWESVRQMAKFYPGPVDVYVLDDSSEPIMERMALRFGFIYQRRPNRGWFKKAGNMRYAFERSLSDYILVLDADFAPRVDMLHEMIPYMEREPDLGIVQSPQFFRVHRGQGWLERGAGAVQELFYRSVQVSRNNHEAAICVGSCALYRREALAEIGGNTLIDHSEDVHTGFDLRTAGWRLRYIPVALAAGVCPADVNSFFTQQYRWCAGSMSLLGSKKFWKQKLSLRGRLSYISGFCYYLHTGIFTLVVPIVPLLMLTVFPQQVGIENYLLIVPSILYNFVFFPLWHRSRYGFSAWTVKMIYGWSHLFAVVDILRGRRMGWQPTGGTKKKSKTRRLWIAMWAFTFGTGVLWAGGAAFRMVTEDALTFTPLFLTGMFYLAVAGQALLVDPDRDRADVL